MKFKNTTKTKSKTKKAKSPKNSRTNTDKFKFSLPKLNPEKLFYMYRKALKVLLVVLFALAFVVVGIDIKGNIEKKTLIDVQRGNLVKNLNFWEDFITKHDGYRDAYFQAAILEYQLDNISDARLYVEKGLALDPNSNEGRKIKKLLE